MYCVVVCTLKKLFERACIHFRTTYARNAQYSLLEPALQGWGRPWVVCAPAVHTAGVVINNRGNIVFGCDTEKHSRGFGPYTPHGVHVPKGSVCIHGTNSTFEFVARPGRCGIAYNATSGCLRNAGGGNDDASGLFP